MTKLDFADKENDNDKTTMTTPNYPSPSYHPGSNSFHQSSATKSKNKNKHKKKNKKSPPYKNFHHHQQRHVYAGPYAGAYPGGLWQHVYGHPMPPVGYYNHHHPGVLPPLAMNAMNMNHAFPRAGFSDGGLYLRPPYHGGYQDPFYHARMSSVKANVNVNVNVVSPEKSSLSAKAAPFVPKQWNASTDNDNDDGTNTNDESNDATTVLLADVESTAEAKKKKRVRTKNNKNNGPNTPKTANINKTVLVTPPPGLSPPPALEKPAVNVLSPPRLEKTSKTIRTPKGTLPPPPGLGGKVDQVPSTAFLPTALLAATGPVFIEDDNEEDEQRSVTGPSTRTNAHKNSNSPSPVTVADFQQAQDSAWAMMHDWSKSESGSSAIQKSSSAHNFSSASAWQTPGDNKDNNGNSNNNNSSNNNKQQQQPSSKVNKASLTNMREHLQTKKSAWGDPSTVLAAVTQKPTTSGNQQRLWSNVASSSATSMQPPAVNETTQVQQKTTSSAVCSSAFPPLGVEARQEAVEDRHEEKDKVNEEAEASAEEDSPFKISPMDMLRQRHGIHFANTPGKNKF